LENNIYALKLNTKIETQNIKKIIYKKKLFSKAGGASSVTTTPL
jgi:hypothetical protein